MYFAIKNQSYQCIRANAYNIYFINAVERAKSSNFFRFSERDNKMTSKYGQNLTSVIARFCYNHIPKSCDHGLLNESLARPCTVLESYVSSSEYVTLELRNIESSVLQYVCKNNDLNMDLPF